MDINTKAIAMRNIEKLNDINSIYLKNLSLETLITRIDSSYINLDKDKVKSISIIMPEILKRYKNIMKHTKLITVVWKYANT